MLLSSIQYVNLWMLYRKFNVALHGIVNRLRFHVLAKSNEKSFILACSIFKRMLEKDFILVRNSSATFKICFVQTKKSIRYSTRFIAGLFGVFLPIYFSLCVCVCVCDFCLVVTLSKEPCPGSVYSNLLQKKVFIGLKC